MLVLLDFTTNFFCSNVFACVPINVCIFIKNKVTIFAESLRNVFIPGNICPFYGAEGPRRGEKEREREREREREEAERDIPSPISHEKKGSLTPSVPKGGGRGERFSCCAQSVPPHDTVTTETDTCALGDCKKNTGWLWQLAHLGNSGGAKNTFAISQKQVGQSIILYSKKNSPLLSLIKACQNRRKMCFWSERYELLWLLWNVPNQIIQGSAYNLPKRCLLNLRKHVCSKGQLG